MCIYISVSVSHKKMYFDINAIYMSFPLPFSTNFQPFQMQAKVKSNGGCLCIHSDYLYGYNVNQIRTDEPVDFSYAFKMEKDFDVNIFRLFFLAFFCKISAISNVGQSVCLTSQLNRRPKL